LPDDMNIAALADPTASTVVFMGKRTFPKLVDRLCAAGLPGTTPALLAEGVSTEAQRIERHTVQSLADQLTQEVSDNPALILFGSLCED